MGWQPAYAMRRNGPLQGDGGIARLIARSTLVAVAILASFAISAGRATAIEVPENDYPSAARADYVFACLQVNGQDRDTLLKCSCSIDVIAEILPYAEYEEAETIMSVIQRGGENVAVLRAPMLQEKVTNLKRAQVEGELRCF